MHLINQLNNNLKEREKITEKNKQELEKILNNIKKIAVPEEVHNPLGDELPHNLENIEPVVIEQDKVEDLNVKLEKNLLEANKITNYI